MYVYLWRRHWEMVTRNLDWKWLCAGSSSARGKHCVIFGRSSLSYGKVGLTKSVQFFEGAGSTSLATKITQFMEGTRSSVLGPWKKKLSNSLREPTISYWELGRKNSTIPRGNLQLATWSFSREKLHWCWNDGLLITSVKFLRWGDSSTT